VSWLLTAAAVRKTLLSRSGAHGYPELEGSEPVVDDPDIL
jgi:hypothetical protein